MAALRIAVATFAAFARRQLPVVGSTFVALLPDYVRQARTLAGKVIAAAFSPICAEKIANTIDTTLSSCITEEAIAALFAFLSAGAIQTAQAGAIPRVAVSFNV